MNKKSFGYLCLVFICIVWGTTYLFTSIAVTSFPPFMFAGIRNVIAGSLLLGIISFFTKNKFEWTWKNIWPNIISGVLTVGFGNGLVTLSVQYIPSGLASLICAIIPLNIVVLSLFIEKNNKLNTTILLGLLSGILGMGFVFKDNVSDLANPNYFMGIVIVFIASASWSVGTVFSRARTSHTDNFYNSSIQLMSGGIISLIASFFTGDWNHIGNISNESVFAFVYLIIVGSTMAFAAYQYALSSLPVGIVATYAYINPLIAVVLGYLVLREKLTWFTLIAFTLTMLGVYFVNRGYNFKKATAK